MSIGAAMAGGNPDPARGRDPDEYYATPAPVTVALMQQYGELFVRGKRVWEPCAGCGMMMDQIRLAGAARVIGTDTAPRRDDVIMGNVLKTKRMPIVDAIITNPPFNLAPEIISHILCLPGGPPPFLAMVLKATFWHAASREPLFRKHTPSVIHPLLWRPDFKDLGRPTMEIMWCVWINGGGRPLTSYDPMLRPEA